MLRNSPLLYLPGMIFEGIVRMRNLMYDSGFLPQRRLPFPVISVGNITLGGSGKTPLAIHLAQTIAEMGGQPALLSRGYGRIVKVPILLPPNEELSFPDRIVGDEPAIARRHAPQLWLGISKNRHGIGMQIARRERRPVFILDDGFQHRRLKRNLDIVIIDRSQPLEKNRVLPRGTLREPLAGLRRADIIMLNGACTDPHDPGDAFFQKMHPGAAVFHCLQQIAYLTAFSSWRESPGSQSSAASPGPVFLVAAIGNPERFRRDVVALGMDVRGVKFFRDHSCILRNEWLACAAEARAKGATALITTEKDAIKLDHDLGFPLYVAVQSMRVEEQAQLNGKLSAVLRGAVETN